MLEAHIMQAQAAAMAADERELQRISEGYENYQSLGLPPGKVHGLFVVFIYLLIIYLHDSNFSENFVRDCYLILILLDCQFFL